MACSSGIPARVCHVVIPTRGPGQCPKAKSADRLEEKPCNTHDGIGDEVCIAGQDLVLIVDQSGSWREGGAEILRAFIATLTGRSQSVYYEFEDMKLGVVAFGTGYLSTQPLGNHVDCGRGPWYRILEGQPFDPLQM